MSVDDEMAEQAAEPSVDTTAVYLAKRMCAERGWSPATVPAAEPLTQACDIVLTKGDGMSFQLLCIVDCEADPARRFGLSRDAVTEIGKQFLSYTGTVHGSKMPVGIQVWEVGPAVGSAEDRRRLKQLSRRFPGGTNVAISAWSIDTASGRVASTLPFNGYFAGRRYLERLMTEPRLADHEIERSEPAAVSDRAGVPWVTCALLAILAIGFVAELVFAVRPWTGLLGSDIITLVATGGLMQPLVEDGEWHRMFTSAFLHADLIHLVLNGLCLLFAGVVLERLLGRAWLVAIFVVGALGGATLSYALNPPTVVSVGASGAIMALLAAAFITAFRLPSGVDKTEIQMRLVQILIPSLIPLATHRMEGRIDFAGHIGGAIVGTLVGVLVLKTWPRTSPLPRFQTVARVVAGAGLVLLVISFALVAKNYGKYVDAALAESHDKLLIPDDQLPQGEDEMASRANDLVARYPRDPRARLFHALRLARDGDTAGAQSELRRGLDESEILRANFPDRKLETGMRGFLAEMLLSEGKKAEADQVAAPVCRAGPGGAVPETLRELSLCQ
jgi:rhomboid protease GluP